jgi:hypothetical protein
LFAAPLEALQLECIILVHLHITGRRLPYVGQYTVPNVKTVPDFFHEPKVFAYCVGCVREEPRQQMSDETIRRELRARGIGPLCTDSMRTSRSNFTEEGMSSVKDPPDHS